MGGSNYIRRRWRSHMRNFEVAAIQELDMLRSLLVHTRVLHTFRNPARWSRPFTFDTLWKFNNWHVGIFSRLASVSPSFLSFSWAVPSVVYLYFVSLIQKFHPDLFSLNTRLTHAQFARAVYSVHCLYDHPRALLRPIYQRDCTRNFRSCID